MRAIFGRCSSLYVLSVLVLLMALLTWSLRRQQKLQTRLFALQSAPAKVTQDQRVTQRAVALLYQSLLADTHLTYTALTQTWANYGGKTMRSQARVARAPQKLAIEYLSGDRQGLHTGFSERWFWRQENSGALARPFATTMPDNSELATRRFATLLENYGAEWQGNGEVDGRAVEVVELWPFHLIDGAQGPGKKLWIDSATNLVLRVETYNHQRQLVMDSELREVNYNPQFAPNTFKEPQTILADAENEPLMAQDMGQDAQAVARSTGLMPPRLEQIDLPPGFQLEAVGMHHCTDDKNGYAALSQYTDGLNTLTLFAMKERAKEKSSGEQSCEFGPGSVVVHDTAQGCLIAVGDLPPVTLRRMVEKAHVEVAANQ